jgi:hypothetical protein
MLLYTSTPVRVMLHAPFAVAERRSYFLFLDEKTLRAMAKLLVEEKTSVDIPDVAVFTATPRVDGTYFFEFTWATLEYEEGHQ